MFAQSARQAISGCLGCERAACALVHEQTLVAAKANAF